MNVTLQPVTRQNWLKALELSVNDDQRIFVPAVAVSLAKVAIKPDGDLVQYLPFGIYDGDHMVGFMMHSFDQHTTNMYWINGFLIDARHQGKGYGRAALTQMIQYILNRFPQCREIRLTVHKHNPNAQKLYATFGFLDMQQMMGDEHIYRLPVR